MALTCEKTFPKQLRELQFAEPLRWSPAVPLGKARFRGAKTAQRDAELGEVTGNKRSDADGWAELETIGGGRLAVVPGDVRLHILRLLQHPRASTSK